MLSKQSSASTHTGVRQLFSQQLIKTGIIGRNAVDVYFELCHYRQWSDDKDEFCKDPNIAANWLVQTQKCVTMVAHLVDLSVISAIEKKGNIQVGN